jgi:UDP-N-acetylglucosamine--N-acetylmuramyl-(pentapeptide) pyrophosphoryl-undecaprenol N-acetylglucosamine transferase
MGTKIIISGGGTGGHIFPAISIANALRQIDGNIGILFVGAEGKMEMEKVPAAGYHIMGLPVIGINRSLLSAKNLSVPAKLFKSIGKASTIIDRFKPDVVVGVGGYASAPILWSAQSRKIPTLIQEQNSYAGLTNKLLAKRAKKVCVAYDGMGRFFNKEKIIFTGNPVRQDLSDITRLREEALNSFDLELGKRTILITGGSLGARTMNLSILHYLEQIAKSKDIQVIWQIGELYAKEISEKMRDSHCENIKIVNFIKRIDYAYAAADLVISRAGAGTISELCIVRKPSILVPSPNVAEDHQTSNAMALVNKNAAILVPDSEAVDNLIPIALKVIKDNYRMEELALNISKLAITNAADVIAREILSLAHNNK